MAPRKQPQNDVKATHGQLGFSPSSKPKAVRTIHADDQKGQHPVSKAAMETRIFLLMNMIGATPLS